MRKFSSLGVYCSASNKVDPDLKYAAIEVADLLLANQIKLVYGGGHVGLMGAVSDRVMRGGGVVEGVIPRFLCELEKKAADITKLHFVETMHERKDKIEKLSDGFIILPGGYGTLDEFFEILTWRQVGLHDKPIVVYNKNGFWDPLKIMLDHIVAENFAPELSKELFTFVDKVEDILPALAGQRSFDGKPVAALKWTDN